MYRSHSHWLVPAMMIQLTITGAGVWIEMGGVTRAAAAEDSAVWELQPYRIGVLLVADWSPAWSDDRLTRYVRCLHDRAAVEVGHTWQVSVTSASLPLRRVLLSANSPQQIPRIRELLESYRGFDKIVVVFLRMSGEGGSLQAWELDWASHRWSVGPRREGIRSADVPLAAFEMMADAVSPLAVVTLASGSRVMLRERAALLPMRNPRRSTVRTGSVFEVFARNSVSADRPSGAPILLVVEKCEDHVITCKVMAGGRNPMESLPPDAWVAVGLRVRHAETTFRLLLTSGYQAQPLTGCDVWLADRVDGTGVFAGHVSPRGEVVLPGQGGVQWLQVKVGTVTLLNHAVLVGAESLQIIRSDVTPQTLWEAAVLAECRDDVAELLALRDTFLARHQHRLHTGQDAAAVALWEEMRTVIQPRVEKLNVEIRRRRGQTLPDEPHPDDPFGPQWQELVSQLSQLELQSAVRKEAAPAAVEKDDAGK